MNILTEAFELSLLRFNFPKLLSLFFGIGLIFRYALGYLFLFGYERSLLLSAFTESLYGILIFLSKLLCFSQKKIYFLKGFFFRRK